MESTSRNFPDNAVRALGDGALQASLAKLQRDFRRDRADMLDGLPEFETLRQEATAIKDHVLAHLDLYLEAFEERVLALGGRVHWCETAADARRVILDICRDRGARTVVKGKSMVSEEIALNKHLEANGIRPVETDLGEYILQVREETPSHIVMPAIHLDAGRIAASFRDAHDHLDPDRPLDHPDRLLDEARSKLRGEFLSAQVGITGANFLIAESGAAVIVTNEGNGDLAHTLPATHIVLTSIEKLVPTMADAFTLLRVLARSATTQDFTSYTTFVAGPRQPGEADGPEEFHLVMLDNGRSRLLGGPFHDVLRCIRCGACQSLCPVYGAVGGHAYGWVYGGPVGAVLTPALAGPAGSRHLPEASTLCGKCEAVCPVHIPLPALLRRWREDAFQGRRMPAVQRAGMGFWAFFARRPMLYRLGQRGAVWLLWVLGRRRGRFRRLPLAGGWTSVRDMPAPEGGTFVKRWRATNKEAL